MGESTSTTVAPVGGSGLAPRHGTLASAPKRALTSLNGRAKRPSPVTTNKARRSSDLPAPSESSLARTLYPSRSARQTTPRAMPTCVWATAGGVVWSRAQLEGHQGGIAACGGRGAASVLQIGRSWQAFCLTEKRLIICWVERRGKADQRIGARLGRVPPCVKVVVASFDEVGTVGHDANVGVCEDVRGDEVHGWISGADGPAADGAGRVLTGSVVCGDGSSPDVALAVGEGGG
jgi:hypothetical protein